jgi:hypothetical protein
MIIYNITSVIPDDLHEEWLDWMQHTHIPGVLATGKFTKARLLKVLVVGESGGHTYSMQFYTENKATLEKYYQQDAQRLRDETAKKFGDKIHSFRTELQIICDHKSI